MCNPAAIGLVVAGTALQVNAQSRRQAAMKNAAEDAQNAELFRQQGLTKEREQSLDPAMANATRASQDAALADAAAKREAAYGGDTTLPGDEGTAGYQAPSAAAAYGQPKIIQEENDKQRGKADADVRSIGNARARLQSYGDVGLGNSILNQNAAGDINMLGGFSRMSSALLPGEVQAAMASKAGTARNQELLGTALQLYGGAGAPGTGGAGGFAGYGSAMGGSANAGATVGGYSGNLAGFAPSAGAAGEAAADAAAPGLMGGLFSNLSGSVQPWWQQAAYKGGQSASGIGSLLARR
jgi:hypothetical protein